MFRFTIRDMLWLTVVVAVMLALWIGRSREIAALREESAAREAKLRDEVAAERDKAMSAYRELIIKSKMQEATLERVRAKVKSAAEAAK
jgi:hypothetical protein